MNGKNQSLYVLQVEFLKCHFKIMSSTEKVVKETKNSILEKAKIAL